MHAQLSNWMRFAFATGSPRMGPQSPPVSGISLARDLCFIAALLAIAAFPLLALRHHPLFFSPVFQSAIWLFGAGVLGVWIIGRRRPGFIPITREEVRWPRRLRTAGLVLSLAAITYIVFYLPMRQHFWAGYDEMRTLHPELQSVWSDHEVTDQLGRPTWGIGPMLGQLLTPNGVEGHLWLSGILIAFNAVMLYGLIRWMLPTEPMIAAAASVLLICHRGDSSRFYVMWTGNWYWTTLAILLASLLLLLKSAQSERRGVLVLACLSLAVSLLGNEAGYPLAALGPILLYLDGIRGRRLLVWCFAWLGTTGLMAARYVLYMLTNSGNYQSNLTSGIREHPGQLLATLKNSGLTPFYTWFEGFRFTATYWSWVWGGLAAVLAFAAMLLVARAPTCRWRDYLMAFLVASVAAFLGLLPFALIGNGNFRTQFYTAPGQAASIAIFAGALCRVLGRRCGVAAFAVLLAFATANSRVENVRYQANIDKHINFIKTVRTFEQLRAVSPTTSPDTLFILQTDDDVLPLGGNKSLQILSHDLIGYGNVVSSPSDRVRQLHWNGDGVIIDSTYPKAELIARYPYDRIVVFRMANDGTLFLLRHLSPQLWKGLSPEKNRYDPLPLLRAGPITPIRLLSYPSWVNPPRDVIDSTAGLGFGSGWSDQEVAAGSVFRVADPGAELLVNPLGEHSRTLQLELEPDRVAPGESYRLEARDSTGRTLARTPLPGTREVVQLTIPTDPERVSLVSLWVCSAQSGEPTDSSLRVYAPEGTPALQSKQDIVQGRLRVGQNWYPLEHWKGETFRWLNTGAELVIHKPLGEKLVLDARGGAGLSGTDGRLRVVGPDGRIIHEAEFPNNERREIICPLPRDLPKETVLRLEVLGGGVSRPGDTRIMNLQVFHCELRR